MKVVALGGCGGMGQVAARTAIELEEIEELTIADRDERGARAVARELGPKARAVVVDVTDRPALLELLEGADAVMSTVGPYYRFGVPVLRAAIEARCLYIDVCDDWEPTLEMLELDAEAREAGVTAVIGMGASPGVTNLLAARAMSSLDRVDDLFTGWALEEDDDIESGAAGGGGRAALEHWMLQCSGLIRVVRHGRETDVEPLEQQILDYPGRGPLQVWSVGHPEPLTLKRYRPELRDSLNVMVGEWYVTGIARVLGGLIDCKLLSVKGAASLLHLAEVHGDRGRKKLTGGDRKYPPLFALARGERDGRSRVVAATLTSLPPGGMGALTGIPLALGMELLLNAGEDDLEPGVVAPEMVLDPDRFFDRFATYCTPPRTGAGDLLEITES